MNQINYSFLLVILYVTSLSTSPLTTSDITMTRRMMELTGTETNNLAMTVTTDNGTVPIVEEMNVTDSSELVTVQESAKRLKRDVGNLEAIDDSVESRIMIDANGEDFNLTSMSSNIAPLTNASEIRTFMDGDGIMDEVTTVLPREETVLKQLSSTLPSTTSTVQQSTGTRGEAKSGAIYEKTDGVRKRCQLHADCYGLREPKVWSDLKFGSWT
ncbi:unnamed protein product [Acanthocheilonema viteae]|uniref:Uncharacterized protein n=1 Tax=Acanthocheilonema viteae TaxID=6277 RepID=A0A498S760_ACAVI|nr:unnamed protein product [Acanthocheilonema viteae]